ncbi:MAG: cell surface protein SprA, partial [Bacteroidetes bacterium]|nr:cell surface protein SprA [Bacteroidota bacterium]
LEAQRTEQGNRAARAGGGFAPVDAAPPPGGGDAAGKRLRLESRVTAGGQVLVEGKDYTVDYNLGRLKIINDAILNSASQIKVSFESNDIFGFNQKTLLGTRLDYFINDNFTLGGTYLHLSERPYTEKINIGDEPISNSIYGFDANYHTESELITKLVDKIPLINTKEQSSITLSGEVARLNPGHSKAISKKGIAYIDDFEGSRSSYDLKFPYSNWVLASAPLSAIGRDGDTLFPEARLIDSLLYGYNRAKLSWYTIDPLFLRNNTATPDHLTDDDQSNH